MNGPIRRLRILVARARRPKASPNDLPNFPTDALLPPSAELAVSADASPYSLPTPTNQPGSAPGKVLRCSHPESPFQFADAILHIGDTTVSVEASALEATWQLDPHKNDPQPILGIDGDTIVAGALADDGTITITQPVKQQPVLRRGGPPDGCPCTAIYSECICPVSP